MCIFQLHFIGLVTNRSYLVCAQGCMHAASKLLHCDGILPVWAAIWCPEKRSCHSASNCSGMEQAHRLWHELPAFKEHHSQGSQVTKVSGTCTGSNWTHWVFEDHGFLVSAGKGNWGPISTCRDNFATSLGAEPSVLRLNLSFSFSNACIGWH